jgi:hypothetical protein
MGNADYVPMTLEEKISQAIEKCDVEFNNMEDVKKIVKAVLDVLPKPEAEGAK